MKTVTTRALIKTLFLEITLLLLLIGVLIFFPGCKKTIGTADHIELMKGKKNPHNPPEPGPFYFSNCSNPSISGNFVVGTPTNATITLNYINSPGGSYPAFTSTTVNGITLAAPAGTLNIGSGSIVFTASGTPINSGDMTIPVSIAGSFTCDLPIAVLNAPLSGNCTDPGVAVGSTGCVTFTYRGQQVSYATVRAADGKIWLQQNLGSPQVAFDLHDAGSYGHYFQWGRWDDGHQLPTGPSVTASSSLQNPSHIPQGNVNFIKGTSSATSWWGTGGAATNTWSNAPPSVTNGLDPGSALGPGWHIPTSEEWINVMNAEVIHDSPSAFLSNLKLTESGYRNSVDGVLFPNGVGGYYWSSSAANTNLAKNVFIDINYSAINSNFIVQTERGYGFNLRLVKD